MKKPELSEKTYLNVREAIELFGLSARKFTRFLKNGDHYSFLAFYHNRVLILRDEFQRFLENEPKAKEELLFKETAFKARRIYPGRRKISVQVSHQRQAAFCVQLAVRAYRSASEREKALLVASGDGEADRLRSGHALRSVQ